MKKIIITIMLGIMLLNLASAEIQYYQYKAQNNEGRVTNHLYLAYSKEGLFGQAKDYVSGGNPYEVYLTYSFYPKSWNEINPDYKVEKCELIVRTWTKITSASILINQTFTEADADISNKKHFFRLYDGDGFMVTQYCYFESSNYSQLYLPAEMQVVTPSWECKECQYYEWSVAELDVVKAETIGNKVVETSDYIKMFFLLHFEIWLAFFWLFLILMIFLIISLIFFAVYWLYLIMRRWLR